MWFLIARDNGLRNPDFVQPAELPDGESFAGFLELFPNLSDAGVIEKLGHPSDDVVSEVWVDDWLHAHSAEIEEMMALLGLPIPKDHPGDYVIPIFHAFNREKTWAMGLFTRSTFDLVEIMRASVQVPPAHQSAGLTRNYPPLCRFAKGIRIASSKSRPKGWSPAVQYRDYWYYIEDTDQPTKTAFAIVRALWSICIAGSMDLGKAPVYDPRKQVEMASPINR